MANDLNQCNFTGRFGQDPESKYMPSGAAVCNFSLAVGRTYKNKDTGQKVEDTQWVDFVAFGKTAEIICEYMRSGSQCRVTGRWQKRKWQAKDGSNRYTTEIIVEDFQMLGSGSGASRADHGTSNDQSQASAYGGGPSEQATPDYFNDDIPF